MAANPERRRAPATRTGDPEAAQPGRFAYDGLQRVFHEKARLGIMTSLMSHGQPLAFSDLKDLCALSDGNLNRHLEVLREAGFIEMEKSGAGRSSKSTCHLTALGRECFERYLVELEQVIADATRNAAVTRPEPRGPNRELGLEFG